MRLLVTNDDGIGGEGLLELVEVLSREHEVWVVAPDRNRSACSHAITMTDPLRIVAVRERWYTCSGVPADCVMTALKHILPSPPDAVISGINKGANLGTDVLYSGTCAAARQASIAGLPGIALSIELRQPQDSWNYGPLACFVRKNMEAMVALCRTNVFVNVNALSLDAYEGWKFTGLCRRLYNTTIETYRAPDGSDYAFLRGGNIQSVGDEESDYAAVSQGLISISCIHAQPSPADDNKGIVLNLSL